MRWFAQALAATQGHREAGESPEATEVREEAGKALSMLAFKNEREVVEEAQKMIAALA